MDKIGTLEELGYKPGDVVELVDSIYSSDLGVYTIENNISAVGRGKILLPALDRMHNRKWRIISRAADKEPPLFRDMTPEEQGALLLAKHHGKRIEWRNQYSKEWKYLGTADLHDHLAYRIAPEPEVVAVTMYGGKLGGGSWGFSVTKFTIATHKITFTMRDGEIDDASFKSERLK